MPLVIFTHGERLPIGKATKMSFSRLETEDNDDSAMLRVQRALSDTGMSELQIARTIDAILKEGVIFRKKEETRRCVTVECQGAFGTTYFECTTHNLPAGHISPDGVTRICKTYVKVLGCSCCPDSLGKG